MLTTVQIKNAYLNSGLDSYDSHCWMRLNEQERWEQIEELIKGLVIRHTEHLHLNLPPTLQELLQAWQIQTEAFDNLLQELVLSPANPIAYTEQHSVLSNREEQAKENARQAAEILASYVKNFGNFEQNRLQYWPAADFVMHRYYYDLEELNEWLNWFCQLPKAKDRRETEVKTYQISAFMMAA